MKYSEFLMAGSDSFDEIADKIAEFITIRTYDKNGCSHDDVRETSILEKNIIRSVARGALLSIVYVNDINKADAVVNMAEFTLMQFFPNANCYDTIYCPLKRLTGLWDAEMGEED